MKSIKKFVALGLAALLALSVAACGEDTTQGGTDTASNNGSSDSTSSKREFVIGSWWRQYYDSTDENMDVSVDWTNAQDTGDEDEATLAEHAINRQIAQLKWDRVAYLEEKYNCTFKWVNLTYEGTKDSINTSIVAGSPDCDIYMIDTSMAIPAQANGFLTDLKTILPADSDLFTDQTVFSYLDLGDGQACILKVQGGLSNTYPLAFNKQMLEAAGLEDPRDLWDKGEWTWDKFIEYCQALTQDTDGDGQIDQYGYCGYQTETLQGLLWGNGATIAGGTTQTLTSAEVGECLQMLQDMYLTYNVCYPYDFSDAASDSMRIQYMQGNVAFFPTAVWIQNAQGNYTAGGDNNLTWDTVYVQWPVGPSGDASTNASWNSADGNFFVIPAGVKDPETVYNFLYDLYNYFDGDTALRDDPATANWWYNETALDEELKASNWDVQLYCLNHPGFDIWASLNDSIDLWSLMDGTMTPAQVQETYKDSLQNSLDLTFGTAN